MYREGEALINLMGSGKCCAVTTHVEGAGPTEYTYYICRERSDDLEELKARWAYYNASFVHINELLSLPVQPSLY